VGAQTTSRSLDDRRATLGVAVLELIVDKLSPIKGVVAGPTMLNRK
jgi:hypothetical protein